MPIQCEINSSVGGGLYPYGHIDLPLRMTDEVQGAERWVAQNGFDQSCLFCPILWIRWNKE